MSVDHIVQIVSDDFTNGTGLRVANRDDTNERFLAPLRHGNIYFAESLSPMTILIVAEEAGANSQGFLTVVDANNGNIIERSHPFKLAHWTRFFVSRDQKVIFASKGFGTAILCWDIEKLKLRVEANLMRKNGSVVSFDHINRYFTLGYGIGEPDRKFHSNELEDEYTSDIENGQLLFLEVQPPLGETQDGLIVVPLQKQARVPDPEMPLGWKPKIEDDGFLLIDPFTCLAKKANKFGSLAKRTKEESHQSEYGNENFSKYAQKTATLTVQTENWDHAGYIAAIKLIAIELKVGVDRLRFGNVLKLAIQVGEKNFDELDIRERAPVLLGNKELRVALRGAIHEYNKGIAHRPHDWNSEDQIYCGNEADGRPALSALVYAYLRQHPRSLEPARRYIIQLDQDHCNDDFLRIGSAYYGMDEQPLRAVIFAHINMWGADGWNHFNALDVAAQYHTPWRFLEIFEEELARHCAALASRGWNSSMLRDEGKRQRSKLLNALRDDFDVRLRALLMTQTHH